MSDAAARTTPVNPRSGGHIGDEKPRHKRNRILNSSPENSESRSQMMLAAMIAFRDGDFSWRLPSDWAGTEGRIAQAFNQAVAHEDRLTREVERLSVTVGRDGRLRQRMSLPGRSANGRRKSNRSIRLSTISFDPPPRSHAPLAR